ncbi:cobalamin biosynthesis protein [Robbsia sp. KACC 23696]|uniref:cobalamin biosynthesis protein n=1 Tax=Robbsia sp. KACC 23696 TaxID=3149231 RepID=UPI00325B9C57
MRAAHGDGRVGALVVGIGCRRGVTTDAIASAIRTALARIPQTDRFSRPTLALLATIEAKANEVGLLAFAERHNVPLRLFSVEALAHALNTTVASGAPAPDGDLTAPNAVRRRFGIENVCEAAARAACPAGAVLLPKTVFGDVTVAIVAPFAPLAPLAR